MDASLKYTSENNLNLSDDNQQYFNASEIVSEIEEAPIGTIVIIVVAVLLTICLLFGLAVVIDCRHQKLNQKGKDESETKRFNISIPKFFKFRRFSNEEDSFADKMYDEGNIIA